MSALVLFAAVYLVVVLIGIVVALVWSMRRGFGFFKTAGVVLAALFLLYAIPFGDHTLGEIKKHQLCKEHGGTKIFQVVENVDGFTWETGRQMQPYETFGYAFVEVRTSQGAVFRYKKLADGSIEEERTELLQARYLARLTPYEDIGQHHSVAKFTIVDVRDNKVLATRGSVAYHGGWLGFGSVTCPEERTDPITFVQQVLKPGKSKG